MKVKRLGKAVVLASLTAVLISVGYLALGMDSNDSEPSVAAPDRSPEGVVAADSNAEGKAPVNNVILAADVRKRSGIQTRQLAVSQYVPTAAASGIVLDLQPLIAFQARFVAVRAEIEAARGAIQQSGADYERVRKLYEDDRNMSLKALQAAKATFAADRTTLAMAGAVLKNLENSATYQFGTTLGRWASDPAFSAIQAFLHRQAVIIQITMPPAYSGPAPARVRIAIDGQPPTDGALVGPAAFADAALQGRSFLYRAAAPLPVNMRVQAQLPLSDTSQETLLLPESTIVWYGGQPWAYVQVSDTAFERRAVLAQPGLPGTGYPVAEGFQQGDRVVTRGAQLLLSEEFRASIRTGDGDD